MVIIIIIIVSEMKTKLRKGMAGRLPHVESALGYASKYKSDLLLLLFGLFIS